MSSQNSSKSLFYSVAFSCCHHDLIIKKLMCSCEHRMQPASAEALLKAFQVMDPEKKGFVAKDVLVRNMLELGEPFTQDELEEMLTIAVDPETGNVPYEYYINQIMVS